ncbi:MAG TPA: hypothetical protein VKP11_08030, partial [Frankiaceae bacterium]|nr:hypothetical protein [Frankiaceae bacterium]
MAVRDARYLDRARWADVNTADASAWASRTLMTMQGPVSSRLELTAGQSFAPGYPVANPPDPIGTRRLRGTIYARGLVESKRTFGAGRSSLRLRAVAAGTLGGTAVPLQRRVFLAGADPYETFRDPFLRSRGAPLADADIHYQAAGGLGLRGFVPTGTAAWGAALNAEAVRRLVERPRSRFFTSVSAALFADVALLDRAVLGRAVAADAGAGLRAAHRIGPTRFVTRVDLPLLVSRPAAGVAGAAGDGLFKFRWVWSLEEAF